MTTEGRRAEKHRKATEYVSRQLKQLNPGEALPPMRTMMRESGVGRNVLERAIRELAAEQQLTVKARSGVYRSSAAPAANDMVVDLVACSELGYLDDPTLFVGDLVNCLLAEGTVRNFSIRIQRVNYHAPVSAYQQLIERQNIRNAILLLPHHNDIPKVFELAQVNHIVLLPRYYPTAGAAVVDPLGAVTLQMEYLIRHGHTRIGLIHTVDAGFTSYVDSCRREEYYRAMAEHGFRVRPEWVQHYSYDEEVIFERLNVMFRSAEQPTALVISDHFAVPVYHFFALQGLGIGRDVSLISLGGFNRSRLHPKLTTLVYSRRDIARLAWDFFARVRDDRHFQAIDSVGFYLEEGDSVVDVFGKTTQN
ncbi:substrate-binding domain-containing protein [Victivallis sp. Marseille-Q1083]|uniref:substrate-binding domain-containing protein n=1 Tax=Victivallis sp. Marseille-Q1083 TaxID=2717288 RepID=UPI001588AB96|nr:substrate-binding domain-containing protein [Victivallis sp. Marseille-Q1083]